MPGGLLEPEVLRGRLPSRLAGPRRVQAVTGQRARHQLVRQLGQVRPQLALVEALDRVGRRDVPAPLVRGGQLGHHRRTDQRVGEPVVTGTITGDQEGRRLAFVDRIEQREHRHPEHLRDHPDREAGAGHRRGPQHVLAGRPRAGAIR